MQLDLVREDDCICSCLLFVLQEGYRAYKGDNGMIETITEDIYAYIMQNREFSVHFQPIINSEKGCAIGCEALLRASYQGEPVASESLFNYVRSIHQERELDAIAREKAITSFSKENIDGILFLNFEASLLKDYILHADAAIQMLQAANISKENIVIEINEKHATNHEDLVTFAEYFHAQGFLIALDDVGEGYSNLNRIAMVKPDIVKIDRAAITDIHKNYYKYAILQAISGLASQIGAVVIAEGVEEKEEILSCIANGVNLFQGYYFAKPMPAEQFSQMNYSDSCRSISQEYQQKSTMEINRSSLNGLMRKSTLRKIMRILEKEDQEAYEEKIGRFLIRHEDLECIYLLDDTGCQITPTCFQKKVCLKSASLFTPAKEGDYHLTKPYYYVAVQRKREVYISERYISTATGNFCKTYSCLFCSKEGTELVLCLDFYS